MNNGLLELLRSDGSIIVNKNLSHAIGLQETILFSELINKYLYWQDKGLLVDGYFFSSYSDTLLSTSFSEKTQRRLVKNLQDFGLIAYEVKGNPKTRYFTILATDILISKYISIGKANILAIKENVKQENLKFKRQQLGKGIQEKEENTSNSSLVLTKGKDATLPKGRTDLTKGKVKNTNKESLSNNTIKELKSLIIVPQSEVNLKESSKDDCSTLSFVKSIAQEKPSSVFDFKIVKKQIEVCYPKCETNMTEEEVVEIFKHFYIRFQENRKERHINLRNEHIIKIINALEYATPNDGSGDLEILAESYFEMIDFYFTQNFNGNNRKCNYSILHFMNDDIRINCFYKACY